MITRPATEMDIRGWFGAVPATMRAIVIEHDGRVLGIAGLATLPDHVQAFSTIHPDAKKHPVGLGRAVIQFGRMLREVKGAVFAACDPAEPTSPGLLAHLGFVPINDRTWRYG